MCKLFKKPVKKQSINQNNKEKEDFIMKINLFNIEEFIDINKLQEVTSPILFQRGDIPLKLDNPESIYIDKWINAMLDTYM